MLRNNAAQTTVQFQAPSSRLSSRAPLFGARDLLFVTSWPPT
jgi:hypothetical protein